MAMTLEQLLKKREDLNTRLGGLTSQLEILSKQAKAAKLKLTPEELAIIEGVDIEASFKAIDSELFDLESKITELVNLNLLGS